MSKQLHTQEPWIVNHQTASDHSWDIVKPDTPNGVLIATLGAGIDENSTQAHNARRIVACVNACAGMDTEEIEDILNANGFGVVMQYLEKTAKQRDALLQMLKSIRTKVTAADKNIWPDIDALIAQVEAA